jgi:hypothetical protein
MVTYRRIAAMDKLSSVVLSAALVVAGVGASVSAEAHPYLSAGVGYTGGAVIEPVGYGRPFYRPYYWEHGRYWRHDFDRGRYDRFHHERGDHR